MKRLGSLIILSIAASWAAGNLLLGILVAPSLFANQSNRQEAGKMFGKILDQWLTCGYILLAAMGIGILLWLLATLIRRQALRTLLLTLITLALVGSHIWSNHTVDAALKLIDKPEHNEQFAKLHKRSKQLLQAQTALLAAFTLLAALRLLLPAATSKPNPEPAAASNEEELL